ncbi:MAG: biotin transporter BioY [Lawsonibacter sp.]|nr:biotin transporter BioY [Lawsonibacter sp.]
MQIRTKNKVYTLAMTAMMAAVIAAVSPFAIPIGPTPITLCTLALYFSPYILGWKRAALATLVYILLGMVGIPVFSGFKAGLGVLMGPTGGYILGYIPMAALAGLGIQTAPKSRRLQLLSMAGATAVLYAFGTAWFCFLSGNSLAYAAKWCILPFIPGDLMKMAAAVTLGPVLRERLVLAGIHPEG